MMIIPIAFGAAILSGLTWVFMKSRAADQVNAAIAAGTAPGGTPMPSIANVTSLIPQPADMVIVTLGNDVYQVAKDYIGPVGIGEAADIAKAAGMQLPTPALVDAIWRQADLKLLPQPRNNVISQAVFDDQRAKINAQIAGRSFNLLGGSFKDVVVGADGFPQLYGWHVEDGRVVPGIPLLKPITPGPGKIIQPLSGHAHGLFYKDYSQGVRLVKKLT